MGIDSATAALLGAVIGAAITINGSFIVYRRTVFDRAADEFRESFIDELQALESEGGRKRVYEIVSDCLIKHGKARIRFQWYIICEDKADVFMRDWVKYYNHSLLSR